MGRSEQTPAAEHAQQIAAELMDRGALGVALTGSAANGTDHADSDLDLIALCEPGRESEFTCADGRLIAVSWPSPEQAREAFRRPADVGMAVPGWRSAIALVDPDGLVQAIIDEAEKWTWEPIAAACNAWVADQVAGLAEEVAKVSGLLPDRPRGAAVNRSVIVLRLAGVMAVRQRLLFETENRLWDAVAEAEGPEWTAAQDAALGLDPAPTLDTGCLAALELYVLAAERVRPLLDDRQGPVVDQACAIVERLTARTPTAEREAKR